MFEALSLDFEALVETDAVGEATASELARLEANHDAWVATLRRMAVQTDDALQGARRLTGTWRDQVVADLSEERQRITVALRRVGGDEYALEFHDAEEWDPARPAGVDVEEPEPNRNQADR